MVYYATTTLKEIRTYAPCSEGWEKLLRHLNKTQADNEPLHLLTILESNGLEDALWCLQLPSLERLSRHFHAWCIEQVIHYFEAEFPDDMRVRNRMETLLNDDATSEERESARAATRAVAWDAERSARVAARKARVAARAVTWDAAWAARVAARVARAAASFTAWESARELAGTAGRRAQEQKLRLMIGG